MPGRKDPKDFNADFLTRPVLHRTTTASDAAPTPYPDSVTATITLASSPQATDNTVILIPIRTVGTGRISYELWVNFPGANNGLDAVWFLHQSATNVSTREIAVFSNLFAAVYKVVVTHEDGGATFETFMSQSS